MNLFGDPFFSPTWFSGSVHPVQGTGQGWVGDSASWPSQPSISGDPQIPGAGAVPPIQSVLPPEVSELKPPIDMDFKMAAGLGLAVIAGLWLLGRK